MQEVSDALRTAFTYVGYPVVIVGIFAFIIGMISVVISRRSSMRTATAAVLPVAALVFVVVTESEPSESLANILQSFPWLLKFLVGAAVAIALLEFGKRMLDADIEIGPPLYVLFLSTTGVFILYVVMAKLLASIHVVLFGFVIGGGLQIIFRGAPEYLTTKTTAPPVAEPHETTTTA